MSAKYVMCVDNKSYEMDLTHLKVYRVLPDEMGEQASLIRVVDNSGEDYLYSAKRFVPVELPVEAEEAFAKIPV